MPKQIATLRYLRIAPRKVRAMAGVIRGLSVNDAEAQLLAQSRRAAKPLLKLLRSAVQNAKHNQKLDPEKLYIGSVRVDQGPMLKRFLPRARGMATPIQKKMSHVTIILDENPLLPPSRFKIRTAKKVKLPPGERGGKKREKAKDEESARATQTQKRPGFMKRMFSRKSGFAK